MKSIDERDAEEARRAEWRARGWMFWCIAGIAALVAATIGGGLVGAVVAIGVWCAATGVGIGFWFLTTEDF